MHNFFINIFKMFDYFVGVWNERGMVGWGRQGVHWGRSQAEFTEEGVEGIQGSGKSRTSIH